VKQRAWLSATPRKDQLKKGERPDRRSRFQRIKDEYGKDSAKLDLPDIGSAQYLADYLFEVGPTTGDQSLTWSELEAWSRRTGVDLSEFESVTLVMLSREFLGMLNHAREEMCPSPMTQQKEAQNIVRDTAQDVTKKLMARRPPAQKA